MKVRTNAREVGKSRTWWHSFQQMKQEEMGKDNWESNWHREDKDVNRTQGTCSLVFLRLHFRSWKQTLVPWDILCCYFWEPKYKFTNYKCKLQPWRTSTNRVAVHELPVLISPLVCTKTEVCDSRGTGAATRSLRKPKVGAGGKMRQMPRDQERTQFSANKQSI